MHTPNNIDNNIFSKKLKLLYPMINNNETSSLKEAFQLCYEFYRIMDIRDKLIYNYHIQKYDNDDINIINDEYKKFLILNNNVYSRYNDEYHILSHAIYKYISSIIPKSDTLLTKFYCMSKYNNHDFRYILKKLNCSISLPIMSYSTKPFITDSDKTLMKSWTIMLNKFILKLISSQALSNDKSILKLHTKINKIIH